MNEKNLQALSSQTKYVSPSVGVVCFRSDDVLLIKRGTPPLAGQWSLPGGRIELGERAEAAALRELSEETHVKAELVGLVDVVDAIFTSRRTGRPARHYLLCDYAARWTGGEPRAGDDAADAAFFSRDQIDTLALWDDTRRVIDLARRLV